MFSWWFVLQGKAVHLLQFFFVSASVISYVAFVLSLFVGHLSFFRYSGKIVLRDCAFLGMFTCIFGKVLQSFLNKKQCRTLLTAVH